MSGFNPAEATDRQLWHRFVYDIKHEQHGPIYAAVEYAKQHPAMVEILRRAALLAYVEEK